ncbi:MAG: cupin domain-containing protein [Chloroflexi bacterium]|nr:cupin domain-containing protein [Chloroflexota bacterium]
MGLHESEHWNKGERTARYYREHLEEAQEQKEREEGLKKILFPEDMPWEMSPQGKIKHIVNSKMDTRIKTVDVYMQEIPPSSRSGKHRHMGEEYVYVLEGKGYDLHWDVDMEVTDHFGWKLQEEPSRWEWKKGDAILIPVNTVHQHFNADPDKPARFISAVSRLYEVMWGNDLEQLEDAPEYHER